MWPAFLLTCLAQAPAPERPASAVARGAHFEIVAHFAAQRAADEALAAAEAALPFAESIYGKLEAQAGKPLRIHLFASAADYLETEGRLAHGAFARDLSFTSAVTHEAYVALRPELSGAAFEITGLPLETRLAVAHEAAHVVGHRLWPNAPSLPYWFAEGSAQWAAEEACHARGWLPDRMQYPLTSTDALRCRVLLDAGALPAARAILAGLPGGLTFDERRAVSGTLFRFLESGAQRTVLARVVDAARRAGPETDISAGIASVLGTDEARAQFDTAFESAVRASAPEWEEVHPALWPVGDVLAQAASSGSNAIAWRTQSAGGDPYSISGELTLLHGANHQMNLLLARADKSFVQVSFTAAFGVDVFLFDAARGTGQEWKKLSTAESKSIYEEQYVAFRVDVEGSTLTVYLGGKPVCAPVVEGRTLQGAWGLGALAGSAGLWRKLAFQAR